MCDRDSGYKGGCNAIRRGADALCSTTCHAPGVWSSKEGRGAHHGPSVGEFTLAAFAALLRGFLGRLLCRFLRGLLNSLFCRLLRRLLGGFLHRLFRCLLRCFLGGLL